MKEGVVGEGGSGWGRRIVLCVCMDSVVRCEHDIGSIATWNLPRNTRVSSSSLTLAVF